ncbi:MAG: mechanosensitive ion channel [Parvularculaceae bacterium]|nr:mechanosensitive ion channel [Parvularculaceae bacterium]
MRRYRFAITFLLVLATIAPAAARMQETPAPIADQIEAAPPAASDSEITGRINDIFAEIDTLAGVEVQVDSGVVTLTGATSTADAANRAETIAARVTGVVTVENKIDRDVSVESRVSPAIEDARRAANNAMRSLPLVLLAIAAFFGIAFIGWLVSQFRLFWRRITPNAFIAELAATTTRIAFLVLAAITALSLLDATALLGALLGAAGVLGLAIGFAVRDTIENYIASIMLSLRQPFRPNDFVRIDEHEGHVVRLTARATILMTPDGNHLRIPNAKVFKAVILNYTGNPERRFEFDLGVDADDDPLDATETGLNAIEKLDFVLSAPAPSAHILNVGDSNIVIRFNAWIDQKKSDFLKSRSVALATTKNALEEAGFALPEPIYRLRFDASALPAPDKISGATLRASDADNANTGRGIPPAGRADPNAADTEPENHIAAKVEEERREQGAPDLLNESAPSE